MQIFSQLFYFCKQITMSMFLSRILSCGNDYFVSALFFSAEQRHYIVFYCATLRLSIFCHDHFDHIDHFIFCMILLILCLVLFTLSLYLLHIACIFSALACIFLDISLYLFSLACIYLHKHAFLSCSRADYTFILFLFLPLFLL